MHVEEIESGYNHIPKEDNSDRDVEF